MNICMKCKLKLTVYFIVYSIPARINVNVCLKFHILCSLQKPFSPLFCRILFIHFMFVSVICTW